MTIDDVSAEQRIKHLDRVVAANATVFKGAQDYTNFIIVAGYAAFSALWSGMVDDLPKLARLSAGGLMGLSLILFIGWELYGVVNRASAAKMFAQVLKTPGYPADFEDRWNNAAAQIGRDGLLLIRFWPWVFIPTVVLGLSGALVLTFSALFEMLTTAS